VGTWPIWMVLALQALAGVALVATGMRSGPPASPPTAAAPAPTAGPAWLSTIAGGALLLLLPATTAVAIARRRGDRLDRLAAAVSAIGDGVEIPPSQVPEECSAVALAVERLAAQWRRRVQRLESRIAEREGLLESLGSGLVALDREQRVRSVNGAAAAILGVDRARAEGRLLHELLRSPPLHRLVERAASGAATQPEEFAVSIGERETVLQASCSRVGRAGAESERGGLLLLLTDVTRLRRLERLRSDFAANVSHELRTPITNIKGYVETLQEVGFEAPEQSLRFLEIIRRNADRLAAIIEDLLTLAQLEGPEARQRLEPSRCAVPALVEAVVESLGPAAEARGISIDRTAVEPLHLLANRPLVEQALANLVSNAIKFSHEGGEIRIAASRRPGGLVCLSVRDTGAGIAAEHLSRLFERFYRIDRARSRAHGGTGLGLAIVKHIAAVHEGRVEVESRLGEGSEFRLLLPQPGAEGPPPAASAGEALPADAA
jgi:two-component system phosphate regulon sensor histidine kinase PhoR